MLEKDIKDQIDSYHVWKIYAPRGKIWNSSNSMVGSCAFSSRRTKKIDKITLKNTF